MTEFGPEDVGETVDGAEEVGGDLGEGDGAALFGCHFGFGLEEDGFGEGGEEGEVDGFGMGSGWFDDFE